MTGKIDISPEQRAIVQRILADHLPMGTLAWVFGSRVTWTAKPFSDLDIALEATAPLPVDVLFDLEEAFEQSDLPWKVDVIDLNVVSPKFRAIVERQRVPVTWGYSIVKPERFGDICKLHDIIELNPKLPLKKGLHAPFIDMAALPTNGKFIAEVGHREVAGSGSKFQNGDTLFARITPCLENGKGGFVSGLPEKAIGLGSTEFIVFRAREKNDEQYAYYLSRWPNFRDFAKQGMEGTSGRQRVTWKTLADFELPELSENERAALGTVLSSLDDKIELNRRMNETLEAMAQAIFRDWFVDFGPTRRKLEGASGAQAVLGGLIAPPEKAARIAALFPDTLGDDGLPMGWEERPLDEIAKQHTKSVKPQSAPDELFAYFSIPAFDSDRTPAMALGETIKSNKTVIPSGAVLLSKLNPEIQRVWLPREKGENRQICSTEFLVYTPREPFGQAYLYSLFSERSFREMLASMVTGTSKSHQRVAPKALATRLVIAPNEEPMHTFEEISASLLNRVLHNQAENRTLSATRDLLLPKLMSGELRLRDAETAL